MMKDPIVIRNLEYERLLNEEIEDERQLVKQLKEQLKEQLKAKEEEVKATKEEGEQKLRTEVKAIEKKARISEKEAVLKLQNKGMGASEIASILSISEEEVKNHLS